MPDLRDVELTQPSFADARSVAEEGIILDAPLVTWRTPGADLADALTDKREVLLITERLEEDARCITVVLAKDPEPLLDTIFNAEQALHKSHPGVCISLRVMTRPPGWSPEGLLKAAIPLHVSPDL
jgi:hypothetical protein